MFCMKYLLTILSISCFKFSALCQNSGYKYEPFGHRTSYEQGYYYSHTGEKISGLIKWECSGYLRETGANFILFKPAKGEKKVQLTTNDVKAFVIGKDSFAIIKSIARGITKYEKDFARVVSTGSITLYSHCEETQAYSSTGIECFYFIRKDGALYRLKRKDFQDKVELLFGDNKGLMNQINDGRLTFDNIEQIVVEYNTVIGK